MSRLRYWLNQLQLSLFGDNVEVSPPKKSKNPPIKRSPRVRTPKNPSPELSPPTAPRMRTVQLGAQQIPYTIERVRRRTVGMVVDGSGLRVRASHAVTVLEIEQILQGKADWILRSLHKMQNAAPRHSFVPDLNVVDGGVLPILGRQVRVFWDATAAKKIDAEAWCAEQLNAETPTLRLREVAPAKREQAVLDALTAILLEYLFQRAQRFAVAHHLRYRVIVLSSAKTLWGTCRSDGTIRLNWRLVFLDRSLVDYVLAHELSHTVHMNHSRLFWAQVAQLCPDYKARMKQLKQYNLRAA